MKYMTFLGKNNYYKTEYCWDDHTSIETDFVQICVLKHHPQIDKMYVFTTKDTLENNYKNLLDRMKEFDIHVDVETVLLESLESYEEILDKMNQLDLEKQSIIMDVTNCFRDQPLKIIYSIEYIEDVFGISLEHIYYGKYSNESQTSEMMELIDFYNESKISESLRQFEQTLKLRKVETIHEKDEHVLKMLKSMENLNFYLEVADFDMSLDCIYNIVDEAMYLSKQEQWLFIHPYIDSILRKFKDIKRNQKEIDNMIILINILIQHHYIQVAITFIYHYYEEWIKDNISKNSQRFIRWIAYPTTGFIRNLPNNYNQLTSRQKYNFIKNKYTKNPYKKTHLSDEEMMVYLPYLVDGYRKCVDEFAGTIRNHINHGYPFNEIDPQPNILKKTQQMNKFLKKLYEL